MRHASMKHSSISAVALAACLLAASGGPVQAQDQTASPAPAPAQAEPAPVVAGEDWNAVSRSTTRVYMVDAQSIKTVGDVTEVRLARVPLNPESQEDKSWTQVNMAFRCRAKESRAVSEIEHDEMGVAQEPFDTGEDFSPYTGDMLDAYVAAVVCDGDRAQPPTYPSIAAFMAAGRPATRR
jgi:hypothetical protein